MKILLRNKLRRLFLPVAMLLIAAISTYYFAPGREILIHADHYLFNNVDELEKHADVIIVGEVVDDFSNYEPTITYTPVSIADLN